MKIGILGCGNISGIYLQNLTQLFKNTEVVAVSDLEEWKAKSAAENYGIPCVMSFEEMLASDEIDTILNITTPAGHYPLTKKALEAGKNVYVEKPLSLNYEQGKELVELAKAKGVRLGCAPDTFLGAGIHTAIAEMKKGAIGRPIGGVASMMCHGHESWHPSPEFYYDFGGGPLFDMGPYYITALVRLLGRAESVFAYGTKAFEERMITSEPKNGQMMPVNVNTHDVGLIKFANGALITVMMSFDVWTHSIPCIEIYGTDGSLCVPNPNDFWGEVRSYTPAEGWKDVPLVNGYTDNSRGIGLSEMALAETEGRPHNASGELGLHVLEIMDAFERSAKEGRMIILESDPGEGIELDWSAENGNLKTL